MNRSEATRLIAVMVAATAQGSRLDEDAVAAMVDAYSTLLGDLSYEQCNAAVRVILQTQTFIPSVGEIRSAVLELQRGPVRSGGDAWGGVLQAIKSEGAYRMPGQDFSFADPVTARCVDCLGWRELCLSEFPISDRARFIELYDDLAGQVRREEQAPMLAAARERRALQEPIGHAIGRLTLVPPEDQDRSDE